MYDFIGFARHSDLAQRSGYMGGGASRMRKVCLSKDFTSERLMAG
nr:MAG TPA: hypothetical protein [Caudoviricetes sp.]